MLTAVTVTNEIYGTESLDSGCTSKLYADCDTGISIELSLLLNLYATLLSGDVLCVTLTSKLAFPSRWNIVQGLTGWKLQNAIVQHWRSVELDSRRPSRRPSREWARIKRISQQVCAGTNQPFVVRPCFDDKSRFETDASVTHGDYYLFNGDVVVSPPMTGFCLHAPNLNGACRVYKSRGSGTYFRFKMVCPYQIGH